MALRSGLLAGTLTAALALPGCSRGPRLTVSWTGADSGSATLLATAVQCKREIRLEAMSGDTGVALVLYLSLKTVQDSVLPVRPTDEARRSRPSAAVAARWVDSARVDGYRGVEGTLRPRVDGKRITGRFTALTRREGDLAEVTLTGSFSGVPIGACDDTAGASTASRPEGPG
jgi:hypothetical protein